eukprot:s1993_g1.t1
MMQKEGQTARVLNSSVAGRKKVALDSTAVVQSKNFAEELIAQERETLCPDLPSKVKLEILAANTKIAEELIYVFRAKLTTSPHSIPNQAVEILRTGIEVEWMQNPAATTNDEQSAFARAEETLQANNSRTEPLTRGAKLVLPLSACDLMSVTFFLMCNRSKIIPAPREGASLSELVLGDPDGNPLRGLLLLDRLLPPKRLPCEHGWSGAAAAIYIQGKDITTKGHFELQSQGVHFLGAVGGFFQLITYCIFLILFFGIFPGFGFFLNFGIAFDTLGYKPLLVTMHQPPTASGSIPLQEYRRDIPPGWAPGNPSYSLREYFEKLRLWYRICGLEDEHIGPMVAGRLYGRAAKVAMALRVRRPDGAYDVGDAALVRLAVDEVVDPTTGQVIQAHIPSGVQHLVQALRNVFGQQDHDMATQALERFFSLTRGKMSLAEYAVEFDTRLDEAHDRAGLGMNEVAKFYLFFKGSGLSNKAINDIKLQVQGDHSRFADARALALRLSPSRPEDSGGDVFYADQTEYEETDNYEPWYDSFENYWYDDYTQDDGYYWDDDGSWYWEGDEIYYGDDREWHGEEEWHDYEEGYQTAHEESLENSPEKAEEVKEEFYKGKSKGKSKGNNDGCFRCGSKWHMARDCPMNDKGYGKSGGKGPMKGKYKGKGKGGWRWRPNFKGSYKGKGKGKKGYKGYGRTNWYVQRPPLDAYDGIQSNVTKHDPAEEFNIHTPPDAEDFLSIPRSSTRTKSTQDESNYEYNKPEKKIHDAFSFAFNNYYQSTDYFMVRGQKRRGLIIDPGAASGLIGSETLRDLVATCVKPFGKEITIEKDVTSPVSGIDGKSDHTLGRATVPLLSSGKAIKFCGEVIGGEGSLCPALVGNPSLRKMSCVLFSNYFANGDGLLAMDHKEEPQSSRLLRLLLTDSGHYILATDGIDETKITQDVQKETCTFCSKVLSSSIDKWPESEINPRLLHVFAVSQAGGNRCEDVSSTSITTEDKDDGKNASHLMDKPNMVDTDATVLHDPDVKLNFDKNNCDAAEPNKHNDFSCERKSCGPTTTLSTTTEELPENVKKVSLPLWKQHPTTLKSSPTWTRRTPWTSTTRSLTSRSTPRTCCQRMQTMRNSRSGTRPSKRSSTAKVVTDLQLQKLDEQVNKRWHFWEIFSGSGRLSLTLLLSGLAVGPIDMRYGWDINNSSHQAMLLEAQREFKPGAIHYAPDCAPWSVSSSSKDPALRHQDRLRDLPALNFVQNSCEEQSREGRGFTVEQPYGSAMMDEGLHLDRIPDCKKKQRVDQCMHGAVSELGQPVQKATALIGNIKYNKTALRCSGHRGQPHAHLQGQTGGHNRTTLAAVYPRQMCQRIRQDVIKFLYSRNEGED